MATTKVKGKQVTYKAPGAGSVTRNLFDKLSELPTRADFATEQDYLNAVASVDKLGAEAVEFTPVGTGAVATTVERKLQESVSIFDFIPLAEHTAIKNRTSTYNCRPAIQTAVNWLISIGGGILLFPAGRFYVDGSTAIFVDGSNIIFQGIGAASEIYIDNWQTGANTTSDAQIKVGSATQDIYNVQFHKLKFKSDFDYITDASWFFPASFGWNTISFGPTVFSTLAHYNCGVQDCIFENTGGSCVGAAGGSNNNDVAPQCKGFFVRNNYVDNTIFGAVDVYGGGIDQAIVSNNVIRRTSGAGILFSGVSGVIEGNTLEYTKNYGIGIAGSTNKKSFTLIHDNTMFRCGQGPLNLTAVSPSIYIGDQSINNKIDVVDNVITEAYGPGVLVIDTGDDVNVKGNLIFEFGKDGVGKTIGVPGAVWAGISAINTERIMITNNEVVAAAGVNDRSEFGVIAGGSLSVNSFFDNNTTKGIFTVKPFQFVCSYGSNGSGTNVRIGKNNFDLASTTYAEPHNNANNPQLPITVNLDTTPSVQGFDTWIVSNGSATTITQLDDGYLGQQVTLYFADSNTTINDGGNFELSANFVSTSGDILVLVKITATSWAEVSRSVN